MQGPNETLKYFESIFYAYIKKYLETKFHLGLIFWHILACLDPGGVSHWTNFDDLKESSKND